MYHASLWSPMQAWQPDHRCCCRRMRTMPEFSLREGANTALVSGDLAEAAFERDLVFISGLSNESADCFPDVIARASAAGARIATNPGVRQLSSRADEFFGCLDRISILTLNRLESEQLVPRLIAGGTADQRSTIKPAGNPNSLVDRGLMAGGFNLPFDSYVRAITSLGVEMLLVTNGSDGAYVGTADAIWHCTVPSVEVAGTAGAGDAFASTFAGMMTTGASIEDALKSATCNAGSVVSHLDTQTGLLTREGLAERVEDLRGSAGGHQMGYRLILGMVFAGRTACPPSAGRSPTLKDQSGKLLRSAERAEARPTGRRTQCAPAERSRRLLA